MYRWCAKHGRLIMFLCSVPVTAIICALFLYAKAPMWLAAMFALILVFTCWGFVHNCSRELLLKAEKALNDQCDPYPLIKETQDQMTYNRSKTYAQSLLIDYCAALINIGEYSKALEEMESINIDKYAGTVPALKVIYYNNLAAIYLCINETEKFEVWHNKSIQILHDLKNQKLKQMLSIPIQHNAAQIAYCKKDYEKAIEILNNYAEGNLRDTVYRALLFAKIYISQGRIEDAKAALQFVIENGNKLIDVQIAKDLLSKVSA